MPYEDILGLLIGLGALLAAVGYLADVYFHPQHFRWLELPWDRLPQWRKTEPPKTAQPAALGGAAG